MSDKPFGPAVAFERLQRIKAARRIEKFYSSLKTVDQEDNKIDSGDPLVDVCVPSNRPHVGFTFEPIKIKSLSSLLKKVSAKKKTSDLEDGLTRSHEVYGSSKEIIGVVFDISSELFVYSGNPSIDEQDCSYLKIKISNEKRYIFYLEDFLVSLYNSVV